MIQPGTTPPHNIDMVSQLNKVARHAEVVQKREAPESKTEPRNRKLTVGPGICLKGEITECDTLAVEGHVELSAKSRLIEIAETGTVMGDIEVKTADVSGRFDGNLIVKERLTIRSTGSVSETILYRTIEIEGGGRISGNIESEEVAKDSAPVVKEVNKPKSMAS